MPTLAYIGNSFSDNYYNCSCRPSWVHPVVARPLSSTLSSDALTTETSQARSVVCTPSLIDSSLCCLIIAALICFELYLRCSQILTYTLRLFVLCLCSLNALTSYFLYKYFCLVFKHIFQWCSFTCFDTVRYLQTELLPLFSDYHHSYYYYSYYYYKLTLRLLLLLLLLLMLRILLLTDNRFSRMDHLPLFTASGARLDSFPRTTSCTPS